jgi:acetyl-CoA carboxylase carboxyl transferase subunit alpha
MATYLDFEEPLKELEDQIIQTQEIGVNTEVDMQDKIDELKKKLKSKTKEIFSGLTPWQRVQLSRHPDRPYTLAYINAITGGQFQELHGDRGVKVTKRW